MKREFGKYRGMSEDEALGAKEEMRRALPKCSDWPYDDLGYLMLRGDGEPDYGTGLLEVDMAPLPAESKVDGRLAA